MSADPTDRERAWVEVDLDAIRRNARRIARHVAPARLVPMVKADAYGLGAIEVARALARHGIEALGVATVREGVELREGGIDAPVVVFAACGVVDADVLRRHGLEAGVLGPAGLEALAPTGVKLHLEIDTGMGRGGLRLEELESRRDPLAELSAAGRLGSVYTHFHSAATDDAATRSQLARFHAALEDLGLANEAGVARHAANSDAIRADRQYHLDLVRPGLYLYGGGRGRADPGALEDPEPVAAMRARVLEVRDLPAGSTVSYGATYTTERPTRLATLSIGYADGLSWRGSNRGHVLIGGEVAPIRGRVCMDVTAVDVTELSSVRPGDVATLLGADGDERIELRDLAERGGTIEYEVLTGLGGRLPRIHEGGDRDEETTGEGDVGNR